MNEHFSIQSHDPVMLEKAVRVAKEFVQPFLREEIVGIVFLGAITRGYFDHSADIDIAIFKKQASTIPLPKKFSTVEGLEVQCWESDYESELTATWDMARRWTYAQGQIYYDPEDRPVDAGKGSVNPGRSPVASDVGVYALRVVFQPADPAVGGARKHHQRQRFSCRGKCIR